MKTVTGKVVSTKPITLSSAAKNLFEFTSLEENGASDAVRVYLKRTSEAFNSLVQFHKELKAPHSPRKSKASRALDFDAKIETLATIDKNPDQEKIKNVENKGKRKKNLEVEVNNEGPLKIEQDKGGVDGVKAEKSLEKKGKEKKNCEFELNNEGTLKIEQGADRVHEVKVGRGLEKKGKYEKNRELEVRSKERVLIERSPDGVGKKRKKKKHGKFERSDDGQERDKGRNNAKQESLEVEQGMDGVEGKSVKRKDKKKKRKKNKDEEDEESFGLEEGKKKRKSREVDGGERSDSAEQSGKKKRKRRKTEGLDEL